MYTFLIVKHMNFVSDVINKRFSHIPNTYNGKIYIATNEKDSFIFKQDNLLNLLVYHKYWKLNFMFPYINI